jgi:hypothetical protein
MNDTSRQLSIAAYYLSKYDMDAVKALDFHNRNEAFRNLSMIFGRDNNYLKLRRDEFDVLTDSHRKGWHNRPPLKELVEMVEYLNQFSFSQMTEIVRALIPSNSKEILSSDHEDVELPISEEQLEQILNFKDSTSRIVIEIESTSRRVYNRDIIKQLKILYNHKCQICNKSFIEPYGGEIVEAHHIESFSKSHNNNANNIIIVCPNHHRLIHKLDPSFNNESKTFVYSNGHAEPVILNYHL